MLLLLNAVGAASFNALATRTSWPVRCSLADVGSTDGGVSITEAGPSDYETVLNLTMSVFFGELGSDFGFNENRRKAFGELRDEQGDSLRTILADETAASFIASMDETVVGFITCSGDGVLTNLAVDPSARRRRVGQRLVQRLLANVPSQVDLEVDWDNQAAFEFYKACGFVVIAEPDDAGARYKVDWWRGRVKEDVFKRVMRYDADGQ